MTINFTHIFQDSWNFLRNRPQAVIFLLALQIVDELLVSFMDAFLGGNATQLVLTPMPLQSAEASQNIALFLLAKQLIDLLIAGWSLMLIAFISQQTTNPYIQGLTRTIQRFLGIFALNIIVVLPLVFSLLQALPALRQQAEPSLFTLFLFIIGIVLYIRLNLTPLHYLASNDNIRQTIKTIWQAGTGRVSLLFVYSLLAYLVVPLINSKLSTIADGGVFDILGFLISISLNVFIYVFTYRFYTLFMQKAR